MVTTSYGCLCRNILYIHSLRTKLSSCALQVPLETRAASDEEHGRGGPCIQNSASTVAGIKGSADAQSRPRAPDYSACIRNTIKEKIEGKI